MVRYTRLSYEETHMMQEREEEADATTAATAVESATEPVETATTIRTPAAMESAPAATTIRTPAATEPMGTATICTTTVVEPAPAVTEPMGTTIAMGPAGTSRMATATSWTEQAETCLEAPGSFLWSDRPRVALVRHRHLLCPATCLSRLRERYASTAGPAAHPCCALHRDRRRVYHCRPRHASHIFALKVFCE